MSKKTKSTHITSITNITLQVSNTAEVPEFYASANPEDTLSALKIGATFFETIKTKSAALEVQALEEQKNAEIALIKEEKGKLINELEAQIEATTAEYTVFKREHALKMAKMEDEQRQMLAKGRAEGSDIAFKQAEDKLRALKEDVELFQERNRILQERKTLVEASRETDIREAEERTRASLQQLLEEKERAIQHAREELDKANIRNDRVVSSFNEILHKQSEEFRNLKESIMKRASNSKCKGDDYEEVFRAQLCRAYSSIEGFDIRNTASSGVGHKGDCITKWGGYSILWECKNYDKAVGESEITKFKRDLIENADVSIGILISRNTTISGKSGSGDFYIEFLEGRMLIYIANMEQKGDELFPYLMLLFRLYWKSGKKIQEDDTNVLRIRQIEKLYKEAEQARSDWRLHKSNMDSTIRWASEVVESSTHNLKCLLNDLQGVVDAIQDIPSEIFRECTGDERAQQIVQTILSLVKYEAGKEILMNDLADGYAKLRNITRDTAKTHIKSVIIDSVLDNTKGKPAKLIGLTFMDTTHPGLT